MNIKEVARQAGVSVATVSRVLNHPELVQPETKTRVLSVMEAPHYTPNWFARGLNLGKTRTIALLVSNIERGTDRDLFAGVETVALKKGYATFLCNTHGSAAAEACAWYRTGRPTACCSARPWPISPACTAPAFHA